MSKPVDYSVMSPAVFEAEAVQGLKTVLNLDSNFVIAINRKGEAFQVTVLAPKLDAPLSCWFGPKCVRYCGFRLRRWHLTCLFACRYRALEKGKISAVEPVETYFLGVLKNRRFKRVKGFLLKKVLAVAECLAN